MKKPISYTNRRIVSDEIKERKPRADKGKKRKRYNIPENVPDVYRRYIYRANAKSIAFELSVQQFNEIINQDCTYCGEQGPNTIDRIDSSKGYISSNVTPCCTKCNIMKFTMSVYDFKKHVSRVYKHLML